MLPGPDQAPGITYGGWPRPGLENCHLLLRDLLDSRGQALLLHAAAVSGLNGRLTEGTSPLEAVSGDISGDPPPDPLPTPSAHTSKRRVYFLMSPVPSPTAHCGEGLPPRTTSTYASSTYYVPGPSYHWLYGMGCSKASIPAVGASARRPSQRGKRTDPSEAQSLPHCQPGHLLVLPTDVRGGFQPGKSFLLL